MKTYSLYQHMVWLDCIFMPFMRVTLLFSLRFAISNRISLHSLWVNTTSGIKGKDCIRLQILCGSSLVLAAQTCNYISAHIGLVCREWRLRGKRGSSLKLNRSWLFCLPSWLDCSRKRHHRPGIPACIIGPMGLYNMCGYIFSI